MTEQERIATQRRLHQSALSDVLFVRELRQLVSDYVYIAEYVYIACHFTMTEYETFICSTFSVHSHLESAMKGLLTLVTNKRHYTNCRELKLTYSQPPSPPTIEKSLSIAAAKFFHEFQTSDGPVIMMHDTFAKGNFYGIQWWNIEHGGMEPFDCCNVTNELVPFVVFLREKAQETQTQHGWAKRALKQLQQLGLGEFEESDFIDFRTQ